MNFYYVTILTNKEVGEDAMYYTTSKNSLETNFSSNVSREYSNVEYTQIENEKKDKNNILLMSAIGGVMGFLVVTIIVVINLFIGVGNNHINDKVVASNEEDTAVVIDEDKNKADVEKIIIKDIENKKGEYYATDIRSIEAIFERKYNNIINTKEISRKLTLVNTKVNEQNLVTFVPMYKIKTG